MELCVCNVSMVRNGMQAAFLAPVNLAINGMELIVKFLSLVVMVEFGMLLTSNASVQITIIGLVILV